MNNQIRVFQKNEVIFREGAYERCMYDILSGSVNIFADFGTEKEKLLTVLEAGQFFGEIGVSEVRARTATAVAAEDNVRLCEINAESFNNYFYNEPRKLLAIMRHMSSRLRALTQDYLEAREALTEAVNTAKQGAKQSEGLAAKLSKLVQNAVKPSFLRAGKGFDEAEFVSAQPDEDYIIKTFRKNEVIFREGDDSHCMYDIRWGSVGIYANYGTDSQRLLVRLNTEEYFGEMGLIEDLPRSATAVALESDTKVRLITESVFAEYLLENPVKVITMMSHLSNRICALTKDYLEACRLAEKAAKNDDTNDHSGWMAAVNAAFVNAYSAPMDIWDSYCSYCGRE